MLLIDGGAQFPLLCVCTKFWGFSRTSRGLDAFLEPWGGDGPVLCNFNAVHKMEPESFTVFINILRRYVRMFSQH